MNSGPAKLTRELRYRALTCTPSSLGAQDNKHVTFSIKRREEKWAGGRSNDCSNTEARTTDLLIITSCLLHWEQKFVYKGTLCLYQHCLYHLNKLMWIHVGAEQSSWQPGLSFLSGRNVSHFKIFIYSQDHFAITQRLMTTKVKHFTW